MGGIEASIESRLEARLCACFSRLPDTPRSRTRGGTIFRSRVERNCLSFCRSTFSQKYMGRSTSQGGSAYRRDAKLDLEAISWRKRSPLAQEWFLRIGAFSRLRALVPPSYRGTRLGDPHPLTLFLRTRTRRFCLINERARISSDAKRTGKRRSKDSIRNTMETPIYCPDVVACPTRAALEPAPWGLAPRSGCRAPRARRPPRQGCTPRGIR